MHIKKDIFDISHTKHILCFIVSDNSNAFIKNKIEKKSDSAQTGNLMDSISVSKK